MTESEQDPITELVMTMHSMSLQRQTKMPLRVRRGESAILRAKSVAEAYGATVVALAYEDGRPFTDAKTDSQSMLPKMTFFFSTENPLSNWHPASFIVNGIRFCNTEQFMMYCKAKLFADEEVAAKILAARTPREHKALGRQVKGFVDAVWNEKRELYVRKGCHAKFSQNPPLLQALLATNGTELVEASPYGRIWGAGLAESDLRILDRANWPGLNLRGKVLMQVRDELLVSQQ